MYVALILFVAGRWLRKKINLYILFISSGTNTCFQMVTICAIGAIGPISTLNEFGVQIVGNLPMLTMVPLVYHW